ncbi:LysR family transcriptional regulator [Vibrio parahaemolyticus O1:K58]|uniref:LysR substrate-binding domain-containing protein n=1 Tax=Vibrio parahaemolyticus TaxID=670 RepID=UPI0006A71E88|nr:LysR substrate-binding domain-containing protein [Vibrio parahaemolyticus]EJG0950053.1 LysR family transcriptional regulator [Vibrio parahaemolyticus O1:K58]EHV9721345.1 LysR family transcriptional regulator [Vibrio parahaemolyticus]EIZ1365559.1 LysR family transcriptional regulator [Vibrio parahaemolyticus]EKO5222340.1 LysR family transcriptional regulator [Vibrio parahaemolyticus]EKO7415518.1 LysR family transcriptional regulator [Vibrio parahaemolyticus]
MDRKQQMLSNMYTFAVAGKCLSFTKAAEELFITQGAVSQRIKSLEEQLGFSLFVRMTRRLELTKEGERLLHALNQSFEVIFSELEDIKFNELRGELYIGVAPTFAQSWLLPRMVEFQRLYPSLNIKLRVKASRLDFLHEPVDIAIYYSDSEHPGFHHQRLFDEELMPVCSPEYSQIHFSDSVSSASQFETVTFIHCTESLEANEPNHEWQSWLASQSNPELKLLNVMEKTYLFNHADMAMIAAKNSMGIAMARASLVQTSLEKGELVAPFERVNAGRGYDLICLNGQQHRPKNAAFIEWLETQLPPLASQ